MDQGQARATGDEAAHRRLVRTVTGLFTGCTLDSSTKISLICIAFVSQSEHAQQESWQTNSLLHASQIPSLYKLLKVSTVELNEAHIVAKGFQLIFRQILSLPDFLNPLVQVNTHLAQLIFKTTFTKSPGTN